VFDNEEAPMIGSGMVLLAIVAGLGPSVPAPRVAPEAFRAWFEAARDGQLDIPPAVEKAARRYQFVFVGGFMSERSSAYFQQNARDLRARDVPLRSIHFVFPSSEGTIEENSGLVTDSFRKIAREDPGKLVVIAHSRGACDALAFALRNPEFVADRVEAMFLVQGPFGGTGLADRVAGDGPAPDRQMPPAPRVTAGLLDRLERNSVKNGKHAGLSDLTTSASHDFWTDLLEKDRRAIPVVGPRTFYVTTATPPGRHRMFLRSTAWYLETYFGTNDGVVALDDQSLPGVGTIVAVLDAGHTDLTGQFPTARASRRLRRALVEAIVMAVGNDAAVEGHAGRDGR
jgi:pimeloyl-ACP methyl ester carboxylesterase